MLLFGELFRARLEPTGEAARDQNGFTLQGGYVFQNVGLAGRLARFELGTGDELRETGVALAWYREGHRLKLESDLRFLDGATEGRDDTELRFQAQLVF